jgi:hypothetical protein
MRLLNNELVANVCCCFCCCWLSLATHDGWLSFLVVSCVLRDWTGLDWTGLDEISHVAIPDWRLCFATGAIIMKQGVTRFYEKVKKSKRKKKCQTHQFWQMPKVLKLITVQTCAKQQALL